MRLKAIKIAFICLFTAFSVLADLPGLAPPSRPVTTLTMTKSGNSIVLHYSVSPTGNYDYYIYRGIAHPEFRAEVLVATITNGATTWTDTDALIRERQGFPVNEFYKVYAVPKELAPLSSAITREDSHIEPNQSIDIAIAIPEGDTRRTFPKVNVHSREIFLSKVNSQKADLDLYNLPYPFDPATIRICPEEYGQRTVVHLGFHGGAHITGVSSDTTLTTHIRQIPQPQVAREGNKISIVWEQLQSDYADTIKELQVIRSYKGVGDAEPSSIIATLSPTATQAEDDISSVSGNWYCFWQIKVVYKDGSLSDCGPSSEWIRR